MDRIAPRYQSNIKCRSHKKKVIIALLITLTIFCKPLRLCIDLALLRSWNIVQASRTAEHREYLEVAPLCTATFDVNWLQRRCTLRPIFDDARFDINSQPIIGENSNWSSKNDAVAFALLDYSGTFGPLCWRIFQIKSTMKLLRFVGLNPSTSFHQFRVRRATCRRSCVC